MRPHVTVAAVCLGWGTIPLVAGNIDLSPAAIVVGRTWLATLGLAAVVLLVRPAGPPLFRHEPARCVVTGALLAAHWTAMFAAYRRAPDSTVIFVIFLAPLGVAALAPAVLGERVGPRVLAALAVALGGLLLIAGPTGEDVSAAGLGLALLSGALLVALVLLSKPLAEAYGGIRFTLLQMGVAGACLLPVAVTTDWGSPRDDWAWLLLLGLGHTAVGATIYLATLARIPATHIGILGYLEPVGVVLFAWALAGDRPALATLVGGALVVAAGVLVASDARRTEVVDVPR